MFTIVKSKHRTIVSVSVAVLLPAVSVTPAGAVTVAVLATEPVAEDFTVAVSMHVACSPEGRLTVVEMLPSPDGAAQLPVPEATQVQLVPVSSAAIVSYTLSLHDALPISLVTTIV